jgi:GTP pyrophosphokinase
LRSTATIWRTGVHLVKGIAMGKLSELIEKNKRLEDHFNNNQREHLTGIYKMLISVTEDVRVV